MSLDKGIANGNEHRKPYRDSRRFDKTCRCHGSCNYCFCNRMFTTLRNDLRVSKELRDAELQIDDED